MHVIHIGLPKTATTTLQTHVFPNLALRNYLGVYQPRGRPNQLLYSRLLKAVNEPDEQRAVSLASQLREEIAGFATPLMISEEGFLVDTKVRWQEKLARLGWVFAGLEVRILVSVRRPLEGAHSLYVELYHKLQEKNPSFEDFWTNSNQSRIYRYKGLLGTVAERVPNASIRVLSFEELAQDQGAFLERLGVILGEALDVPSLGQTNQRRKSSSGSWTTPLSLKEVLLKRLHGGERFSLPGLARFVVSRAIRGPINPKLAWTSKFVEYPVDKWREEIRGDCEWLFDAYSIDYRQ